MPPPPRSSFVLMMNTPSPMLGVPVRVATISPSNFMTALARVKVKVLNEKPSSETFGARRRSNS